MAAIGAGDSICLMDRRLFKDDNTRIFVGTVEETEGTLVRARGAVFHVSSYEVAGVVWRAGETEGGFFAGARGCVDWLRPEGGLSRPPGEIPPERRTARRGLCTPAL